MTGVGQVETRAVRDRIPPSRRIWSGSGVRSLQNSTTTSLSKDTSAIKFSRKSYHSLQRCKPNCGKISQCWRIFKKIPASGSGGRWVPKFNHFFSDQRYICGKIFVKICSVFCSVKLLTDRQTDRQTNARHYITSLSEVIISKTEGKRARR